MQKTIPYWRIKLARNLVRIDKIRARDYIFRCEEHRFRWVVVHRGDPLIGQPVGEHFVKRRRRRIKKVENPSDGGLAHSEPAAC